MNTVLRIILIALTLLVALGLGLLLRRLLIRRLRRTVLDNWIIQTLGIVVVLLPLILAGPVAPLIWDPFLVLFYWYTIQGQLLGKFDLALNLVYTLLLTGLGIGVARTVRALTIRSLGENRIDINIRTLIARIFYYIVLALAVFWILTVWRISVGIPVAAIGILTVAITVAIQDILKDLVAGFYILMERPFHIGDQISITNVITYIGRVEDVQLRATKLRLVSGEEVSIPNSFIFGSAVVNNTFYGERRATLSVCLPVEEYVKDETAGQLLKALKGVENIMVKPEPTVTLSSITSKDVVLTVRFWIANNQLSTVAEAMHALHALLPNAELTVKESAGDV